MKSIILRTAVHFIMPLLLLFSVFLFISGHDQPGGGFIGGLLAATGFGLYAMAEDVNSARKLVRIDLHVLLGLGLLMAMLSGALGLMRGQAFLTASWMSVLQVGTPMLFDAGVFIVVVAVTLIFMFSLAEQ